MPRSTGPAAEWLTTHARADADPARRGQPVLRVLVHRADPGDLLGALGALAQGLGTFITLGVLSAGSAVTAAGLYAGSLAAMRVGGVLFVISAAAAWLTAGSMVLEHAFGRTIIPLGKWSKAANIPGARATDPIAYPAGMPGVRVGQ